MELARSNSKSDWEVWNWVGATKKSDWEVWNLMGTTKNSTRRCGTWWEQQQNPHSQTSTKNPSSQTSTREVTDLVNMRLLTHYCQSRRLNLGAIYDKKMNGYFIKMFNPNLHPFGCGSR
jgi:hypothetical protein